MPEKLFCVKLYMIIIRLPSEASVDQDHEAMLHDIIKRRAGVIQISGVPALFIFLQLEYIQVIRDKKVSLIIFLSLCRVKLPAPCEIRIFCVV